MILEEIVEVIVTRHHDYCLHARISDAVAGLTVFLAEVKKPWHVQAGVIMISDDFFPKLYQTRLLRLSEKMVAKKRNQLFREVEEQ